MQILKTAKYAETPQSTQRKDISFLVNSFNSLNTFCTLCEKTLRPLR